MSDQQSSFSAQIARSFLLLALLTVSMVGIVAYVRGREALQKAAFSRLAMTATLKEKEIIRWLESCEEDFLLIAKFPTVERDIQQLLGEPKGSEARAAAYRRLSAYFTEIAEIKPKFTEISIQNRANQIILSTDPTLEGTYEIATNLTELETVISGEKFSPIFYVSPEDGRPAVTYASKVHDPAGDRQGMILANLNLKRINDIISERTGLDETGKTYLVGSLANKTAFIARPETSISLPNGPHSEGIDAAFTGENGAGLYDDYLGEPVIGVYRWLAGVDVALLAEMSKDEALAPARRLAAAIMLVGLGAAGLLLLGVSQLARQLSFSRQQIEGYSHQLEKTAAAANSANRAKSEFLANMSHELRTPLNAILGFTQLMQRARIGAAALTDNRRSPQTEYLSIISRSGEHLLNLINDVLSMAKIEAGRTTFDPVGFDLRYLLLTLEEMLRMKAKSKALQLSFHIDERVPQFIKTDEIKLRQVLVNLIGNAIKFTDSGSVTLSVSTEIAPESVPDLTPNIAEPSAPHGSNETFSKEASTSSHRIFFQIKDTGRGVAADELAHLFDPFYQASKTRKNQQGTGLGLAISQRFVGLMEGQITVQSVPEKGSTFSFSIQTLPADPSELPTQPIGEVVGIASGQPVYRILVVEDILFARKLLVDLLSLTGFQVQSVENGEAAIAIYKTWHPHFIWMDMRMPVMDGYEATRQIRAIEHDSQQDSVKIVALTASAFEEEQKAMFASGCDDFVHKPFRTHVIFEKMAEHLGVQYLYRNDLDSAIAPTQQPDTLTAQQLQPEDLAVMPPEWIAQLHQAALEVDAERLYQLIDQIPPKHHQLAEILSTFTQNFCFDELIALAKTYA
ncbi:MAG: ATP-binding protein [Phormidesmis sp.]